MGSPIFIILSIIMIVVCITIITLILMQKKRSGGISGAVMGVGSSSGGATYWDKNKKRSLEGMLERYTKIGIAVLFVLTLIMSFVR